MGDHGSEISVDLVALRTFHDGLESDLTRHLSPENDQILRTLVDTPSFGARTASPTVQAAATTYHSRLIELLVLMDTFVHNGEVFVQALKEIVAAYAEADNVSGEDFKAKVAIASKKVDQATWAAEHDPKTGRAA